MKALILFYWGIILEKKDFLKMFFFSRVRILRFRNRIPKEESHYSLNSDPWALMTMNDRQREKYWDNLIRRRNLAHRKGELAEIS
jgi:hypothetical protein